MVSCSTSTTGTVNEFAVCCNTSVSDPLVPELNSYKNVKKDTMTNTDNNPANRLYLKEAADFFVNKIINPAMMATATPCHIECISVQQNALTTDPGIHC